MSSRFYHLGIRVLGIFTEKRNTLAQREGNAALVLLGFDLMFTPSVTIRLIVQPLFSRPLLPETKRKTWTFRRDAGELRLFGLGGWCLPDPKGQLEWVLLCCIRT